MKKLAKNIFYLSLLCASTQVNANPDSYVRIFANILKTSTYEHASRYLAGVSRCDLKPYPNYVSCLNSLFSLVQELDKIKKAADQAKFTKSDGTEFFEDEDDFDYSKEYHHQSAYPSIINEINHFCNRHESLIANSPQFRRELRDLFQTRYGYGSHPALNDSFEKGSSRHSFGKGEEDAPFYEDEQDLFDPRLLPHNTSDDFKKEADFEEKEDGPFYEDEEDDDPAGFTKDDDDFEDSDFE